MVDRRNESTLPRDYIITDVEVREDRLLGEGAYGVVKLGRFYGLDCAVKKLKPSMFPAGMKQLDQQTELILQSFYNECEKMSRIRHPNVVQLLGVYSDSNNRLPVIVMELMNESLSRLLHRTKVLPFHIEVNIVHDVAQALAYLHSFRPPIVHRDLSSNNILLAEGFRAKITDLGVAKVAKGSFLNWDDTPAPGTLVYMPPEVRKVPADLTPAMDIFAIGVNMIQIRTHKFPRPGPEFVSGRLGFSKMLPEKDRRRDHLDLIARSNPLKPLILDCIRDNPRDRPSGMKLCERLTKIKGERDFVDSLQISKLRTENNGVDGLKDQVLLLEQRIIQLTEELGHKSGQVERLETALERERQYTGHLLEQNARDKLQFDMTLAGMTSADSGISTSPPTQEDPKSSPKRKKKLIKLKQLLNRPSQSKKPSKGVKRTESMPYNRKHSDSTSSDGSQTKSTAPSPNLKIKRQQQKHKEKKKSTKRFSFTTNKLLGKAGSAEITEVVMEEQGGEEEEEDEEREEELYEEEERNTTSQLLHREVELVKSLQLCSKRDFKMNKLTWYTHKCLPLSLHGSTLQLHPLSDRLYLCGGVTSENIPNDALLYCSTKNYSKWSKVGPGVPQFYCPSVMLEDELLLISGISAGDKRLTSALSSYNFSSQLWVQTHSPLPTPRSSASAFVYREYLIVMGGQNERGEIVGTVDVLHLPTQHWYSAPSLLIPAAGASAVVCENVVYLVGGVGRSTWIQSVQCAKVRKIISSSQHSSLDTHASLKEASNGSSNVWKQLHDCPFTKMTAVCSGNQLLTLGGEQLTRNAIADPSEWIWIYDREEDTWSPVQGMPSARKLCAVTMLPDSMVIIGGEPHYTHIDIAEIM